MNFIQSSITVIIPAYNAEAHIKRSIDSVLAQRHPAQEIIVVDDGSIDGTAEIVKEYEERVRYIYQANRGVSAARNRGIREAKGEWITFLDADDEWLPELLESQVRLLQRNPDLVWVGADYERFSEQTKRSAPHNIPAQIEKHLQGKDYFENFFQAFTSDMFGCTDTMLIRREVLREVGGFDESLKVGEDLDLWMRIAYRWPKFGFVARPLAVYHLDFPNSLTRRKRDVSEVCHFLDRHIRLSTECGQWELFRPVVRFIVRRTIRAMLFEDRQADVRELLRRYAEYLTYGYRALMYLLTIFPRATAWGCHGISRFIRFFNLRRRVVPLPKKLK